MRILMSHVSELFGSLVLKHIRTKYITLNLIEIKS